MSQKVAFTVVARYRGDAPDDGYIETIRRHLENALEVENARLSMNFVLRIEEQESTHV